jgi:pyridoxal phosphate enzyme (YggS family)
LQTNKAKQAINLFNYIHSLDSEKLAIALHKEETLSGKKIKYFIQVNIAEEFQKSGITKAQLNPLLNFCKNNTKLEIIGLMCIPPKDDQAIKYFKEIKQLANEFNFSEISMGMSRDYKEAILCGATFVRIGSNIYK